MSPRHAQPRPRRVRAALGRLWRALRHPSSRAQLSAEDGATVSFWHDLHDKEHRK